MPTKAYIYLLPLMVCLVIPKAAMAEESEESEESEDEAEELQAPPEPPEPREWMEMGHGIRYGVGNTVIAVASRQPRVVYIGTDVGFVFRSTDGGVTWDETRLLPDDRPLLQVPLMNAWAIPFPNNGLIDPHCPPADEETLGSLGGRYSPHGARMFGLPGMTGWSVNAPSASEASHYGMDCLGGSGARVETEDPGNLMALYFSGVAAQVGRVNHLDVCPSDSTIAFAATNFGVFRTRDMGMTWDRIFIGSSANENRVRYVHCHPENSSNVYIATAQGLRISADGGDSWDRPTGNLGNWGSNFVTTHPTDRRRLLVGTGIGAYETTTGAEETQIFIADQPSPDARIVQFARATSDENIMYMGTLDAGFYTHDGGQTWHRMGEFLMGHYWVRALEVDPNDPMHAYILQYDRLYETFDGGATVEEAFLGYTDLMWTTLDPNEPGAVWLLGYSQVWKHDRVRPERVRDTPLARRAGQALRQDPGLDEVTETAFRIGQIDMESVERTRRRIRRSALLPRLAVVGWGNAIIGNRGVRGDVGLAYISDYLNYDCSYFYNPVFCGFSGNFYTATTGDRGNIPYYGAFIVMTWPLGRAVMDERLTGRMWVDIQRMRERVLYMMYDYWADRHRLLRHLARGTTTPLEELAYISRLEETTAVIDGLTGGLLNGPFGDGWN